MKAPRVSVLLPVRNAARFLPEALDSLWAQDFKDFEVLAVDDASTDGTWALLQSAAKKEPRLRPWRKRGKPGLVGALNFAWAKARGAYLARMDGDDRCHPQRFSKQVARLDVEPSLAVLGSAVRVWKGKSLRVQRRPLTHEAIRARLAFENPIAHPTVMLRRSALGPAPYAEGWSAAEDYELWTRVALRRRLANLPEALLDYRVHAQQSGEGQGKAQYVATTRLRGRYLAALGYRLDAAQREALAAVCPPFPHLSRALLPAVQGALLALLEQESRLGALGPALLDECRLRFAAYCLGLGITGALYYASRGGLLRSRAIAHPLALKAGLKGLLPWR